MQNNEPPFPPKPARRQRQKRQAKPKPKKPKVVSERKKRKEKTQITVRIDKKMMDLAYKIMAKNNQRITDVIEYGIVLFVQQFLDEPATTAQARFIVNEATPDEQWLVTLFLAYLRTPADTLSIYNAMDRETLKKKLRMLGTQSYFEDVMKTFQPLRNQAVQPLAPAESDSGSKV